MPQIIWIVIDGAINGLIENSQDYNTRNRIEIGSIGSTGSIHLADGYPRLFDVSGDADGDVVFDDTVGFAAPVWIFGGDLNARFSFMGATVSDLQFQGDIGPDGEFYFPNGKVEKVKFLGNMNGSIVCKEWGLTVIDGDLSGEITISDGIPLDANIFLRIGGQFLGNGRIFLPDNGLQGWISFNRLTSRSAPVTPVWASTAQIVFGDPLNPTMTINKPDYDDLPSSFGGGAIGLAPFGLHGAASSPALGSVVTQPASPPAITLRHYGLIQSDSYKSNQSPPVNPRTHKIWRRFICDPPASWEDISPSFTFSTVQLLPNDPARKSWAYAIKATPDSVGVFLNRYEYKVEVDQEITNPDRLVCLGVGTANNPPIITEGTEPFVPAYSTEYTFRIDTGCDADLNNDGVINTADLSLLLAAFGNTGCLPSDLNGDGSVDSADLGILISQFGTTCGGGAAAASGGGGGPTLSPLLAEMGFTSVDSYIDWLDTLTTQECIDHVRTLIERIQAR